MNNEALTALTTAVLDSSTKGVPLGETVSIAEIGTRKWNVARGDLALPVTTLRSQAVAHNLAVMAEYCDRHNALFAPHGKTTMSPQLFKRQLDAGAWAMTAATPTQASIMRKFGVPRIIMANELVDSAALAWAAREMAADSGFELYSLVDNADAVEAADHTLEALGTSTTLKVFLEVGVVGGRAGVRTEAEAIHVAQAVAAARHLELVGLETYEGLVTGGSSPEDIAALDGHFERIRDWVTVLDKAGLLPGHDIFVTAGGSSYFDRVVAVLGDWSDCERPIRLILRSGCYLSHDAGKYHKLSPLDGRRAPDEDLQLINALESWATVLSTPEPGISILSTGKRDVAHDLSLPTPMRVHHRDGTVTDLDRDGVEIYKLMDQHAFLRTPDDLGIRAGDIVVSGLSHPCTAFDKCRFIPLIDDSYTVEDAVLTFF
jgi:D-serine dehydratase